MGTNESEKNLQDTLVIPENLELNPEILGKETRTQTFWQKYRGLIFSVIASLNFSFTFLIVKQLQHNYDSFIVSVWRHAAILIPTIPIVIFFQCRSSKENGGGSSRTTNIFVSVFPINDREKFILFLGIVLRGIVGATALLLQVWSLKYLSIGDSSIFTFSAPVFVVLFAFMCLGEKCGVVSVLVIFTTIFGVGLIVRPPILTGRTEFDTDNLKGVILAFISTLLNSLVIIILRRIRRVHWVLILLVFGTIGVIENLIAAIFFGILQFPSGLHDCLLTYVALPVTVYSAQMCIILALKYEEAGPVAFVGTSGVLFSFLLQFAFFGLKPDIYSLAGSCIVILGVAIITCKKWVSGLPQDSKKRRAFRFLLL